ncbi:ABC transporter ATP-binding protein [Bacillus horti]|uniref:ABC transport system ATP-binding protein n=1 Tax=Caldalkalibacillus horti TaxID=77523 RepID=A0ABT9VT82_9BACI|nr:ABC transporter ATP-binding protein [Bacillus horti]MDQ0164201.1 putative ABC transport system ATP-binding protein [Bacillus horti]
MELLKVNQVNKVYGGKIPYRALTDIQLSVQKGEFVGIMGPSGSGKTTLLNLISTIDVPSSGEIIINDQHLQQLKGKKMAHFRRRELGFVFQDFNLLDTLTIAENIVLPLTLDNAPLSVMKEKLNYIAEMLGIKEILNKRTYEVSGGQAQRAAIARAMIHAPSLLLADEPTGNLDSKASRNVMEALEMLNQKEKATLLMVTHDPLAASYCHRVVFIKDGQLYNEIHRGESRQHFFQQIIDVLSLLGGNAHDLSTVRV